MNRDRNYHFNVNLNSCGQAIGVGRFTLVTENSKEQVFCWFPWQHKVTWWRNANSGLHLCSLFTLWKVIFKKSLSASQGMHLYLWVHTFSERGWSTCLKCWAPIYRVCEKHLTPEFWHCLRFLQQFPLQGKGRHHLLCADATRRWQVLKFTRPIT